MEDNAEPQGDSEEILETLELEVKKFAESQPYWAKYAADKILSKNAVSEPEITTAYSYLKQQLKLIPETEKPQITICDAPSMGAYKPDLQLTALKNLTGVNALTEDQVITFGKNLDGNFRRKWGRKVRLCPNNEKGVLLEISRRSASKCI